MGRDRIVAKFARMDPALLPAGWTIERPVAMPARYWVRCSAAVTQRVDAAPSTKAWVRPGRPARRDRATRTQDCLLVGDVKVSSPLRRRRAARRSRRRSTRGRSCPRIHSTSERVASLPALRPTRGPSQLRRLHRSSRPRASRQMLGSAVDGPTELRLSSSRATRPSRLAQCPLERNARGRLRSLQTVSPNALSPARNCGRRLTIHWRQLQRRVSYIPRTFPLARGH